MNITDLLAHRILLFDGAMGTALQSAGLAAAELPDTWNATHADEVRAIHRSFLDAGCDVLTTNNFGSLSRILEGSGFVAEELVAAGVANARAAVGEATRKAFVAAGFGPTRSFVEIPGGMSFDEAYRLYQGPVRAAEEAGADLILFETFSDILELKAAVLAAKENTGLPVFATMTFEKNGRTLMGADPLTALYTFQGLGLSAFGVNCSLGPDALMDIVKTLAANAAIPILAQPNAGLPEVAPDGSVHYDLPVDAFAESLLDMAGYGVGALGGCCGTTPACLRAVRDRLDAIPPEERPGRFPALNPEWRAWKAEGAQPVICSATEAVMLEYEYGAQLRPGGGRREEAWLKPGDPSLFLEPVHGSVSIPSYVEVADAGAQANPAWRAALLAGDFARAAESVAALHRNGAQLILLNTCVPDAPADTGYSEADALEGVVRVLAGAGRVPLLLAGSSPEAVGRALRICKGKAGVSLSAAGGAEKSGICAIAEKYGAVVVE